MQSTHFDNARNLEIESPVSLFSFLSKIHGKHEFRNEEEMRPYRSLIASVTKASSLPESEALSGTFLECYSGFTPLHIAILQNQYNTVQIMLHFEEAQYALKHVQIQERPYEGFTAPMVAMSCGKDTIRMSKLLLPYATPALLSKRNAQGENLLFVCIKQCSHKELAFWLDEAGISWDLSTSNAIGQTLLHLAAALGRLTSVDVLLARSQEDEEPRRRIPVNAIEAIQGDTALHFAMQIHMKRLAPDFGDPDYGILYRLIQQGGDIHIKSRDGFTCLSFCNKDIVSLFEMLFEHTKRMPEYLEQLRAYSQEFIMTQFEFLSPSERSTLWRALQAIHEEEQEIENRGACPVVGPRIVQGGKVIKSEKDNATKAQPVAQATEESAASRCPFLRAKQPTVSSATEQNENTTIDTNQNEAIHSSPQGGKCPVPFAKTLYNTFSAGGFLSGLSVGIGLLLLYRWHLGPSTIQGR